MFRGQSYKENTTFQFVSYNVKSEAKRGAFKVVKKTKSEIPNVAKFKLEYNNKNVTINTNSQVKPEIRRLDFSKSAKPGDQGHVRRITREKKASSFPTLNHRIKLIQLASDAHFSGSKWILVAKQFIQHFNIPAADSASFSEQCRDKFTQILETAHRKRLNRTVLKEDEELALALHKVNHNKTIYLDELQYIENQVALLQKKKQTDVIQEIIERLNTLREFILQNETREGIEKALASLQSITDEIQTLTDLECDNTTIDSNSSAALIPS